jgi:hypothetical protein
VPSVGEQKDRVAGASADLIRLRATAEDPSIEGILEAVREFLDMEVAFTTRLSERHLLFTTIQGDGGSFGFYEGRRMSLAHTYCQRVLEGRLPKVMPEIRNDPRASDLAVTAEADVGSFVSIPLRLADGTVHGTLCAASHEARPGLGYRELQFLEVFARLIVDQIERSVLESRQQGLALEAAATQALLAAVEARDSYTAEHSRHVVDRAVGVADLLGLDADQRRDVESVALLHDIGKIGVPDTILQKPGPLSAEEWETMRRHPIVAETLIAKVEGLEHLAPALRAEHERWDGHGYPDGLAGEAIPILSRIVLVCDAYDAMTTDRPYRAALSIECARADIRAGAGSQFCPVSAGALLAILEGERSAER